LIPAARHLLAARDQAPTMARVHYRLAELAAIAVALGDEQLHLQRAQLLAPGDATLWFWSGALELNSGRVDQACACWQRSLQLSPQLLDDVLLASRDRLTLRQLLDQTLPPRADMLLRVATTFFGQEDRANARQVVLTRARDAVDQTPLAPAEKEYTRGTILQLQGHPQEAASAYAQAISLNGSNLQWRFQYARLLLELQEYDPALEQVKYLIRARPDFPPYQRLQQEFNQQRWRAGMHEAR
jgi:tetratricopeptide (TPR) repeat protein